MKSRSLLNLSDLKALSSVHILVTTCFMDLINLEVFFPGATSPAKHLAWPSSPTKFLLKKIQHKHDYAMVVLLYAVFWTVWGAHCNMLVSSANYLWVSGSLCSLINFLPVKHCHHTHTHTSSYIQNFVTVILEDVSKVSVVLVFHTAIYS